ncbi:MAG: hypothetical protein U9M97_01820 [Candidatus Hadarchaeota archaeon]|nr:hypothetical protein [Candidatus Hadarchaeota archaeon]
MERPPEERRPAERAPVERRPVRRGITAEDILNRPELIMIIAAVLMIIGSFGTWAGVLGVDQSGWDVAAGKATFFMGLIMLYSAAVRLGYVDFLREVVPVLSVSAVCGVVALILGLAAWDSFAGSGWGLYLTIIASLIALFAAFRAYTRSGPGIRRRAL